MVMKVITVIKSDCDEGDDDNQNGENNIGSQ